MIDPLLSLAFSIHANPGVYALLIGSGVSRAAEIPTGWEVVLDLIRKLAHLQAEDCKPDPAVWYKEKYGEEPDYSKLLDQLAGSPAERNQLLQPYFEPDDEERERGAKQPTDAHKAIAELAANGHIRVIVTTNFDRLIERAIEAAGVTPTVISTPDAAEGALPLAHTQCLVLKVHGDFLDTRIKNTPEELASYDERIDRLLDRIFDEYGLIICGWSGEWDTALIAALERCKNHRFTTYWAAYKGEVKENARKLIELRRAKVIPIENANAFFKEITEKVSALREYDKPHPLSAKLAVAILKKYLAEDRHRISLHELVMRERERVCEAISDEHFPANAPFSGEILLERMRRYESSIEILLAMMITGCYWGEKQHQDRWVQCIERIANASFSSNGTVGWLMLKRYPALLLMYAGGIASIVSDHYDTFAALLTEPSIRDQEGEFSAALLLNTWRVMEGDTEKSIPGRARQKTPLNNHLFIALREPLRELIPDDTRFDEMFDRFEYLSCLVSFDLRRDLRKKYPNFSGKWVGRFGLKYRHRYENSIMKRIEEEAEAAGDDWPLLKAGLFGGTSDRFQSIKKEVDDFAKETMRHS